LTKKTLGTDVIKKIEKRTMHNICMVWDSNPNITNKNKKALLILLKRFDEGMIVNQLSQMNCPDQLFIHQWKSLYSIATYIFTLFGGAVDMIDWYV